MSKGSLPCLKGGGPPKVVEGYKRGIWFIGKESPGLLCSKPPLGKGAFERFTSKPYASNYKK